MMQKEKRDTQKRSWLLTIPAENNDQASVEKKLERYRYVGQLERGAETGYEHWQILVNHPHAIRFSTLKRLFPTAHIEERKGNLLQALAYVTKEETFAGVKVGNMKELPEAKEKKLGLADFHAMIRNGASADALIVEHPSALFFANKLRDFERTLSFQRGKELREVKATYIYGKTGAGKTTAIWQAFEDFYRVSNYKHPWDNYAGEDVLVLDEFYSRNVDFNDLLNLLDRFPQRLSARYSDKSACWSRVFVISNLRLDEQYPEVQRMYPEAWKALLRRFETGGVYELQAGGIWLKNGEKSPCPLR